MPSFRDQRGNPITLSTTPILAVLFLTLFGLVTLGAYETDKDLFKTLAQGLLNIIIAVAAYYWGSSQGSKSKDDTIAAAVKNASDQ